MRHSDNGAPQPRKAAEHHQDQNDRGNDRDERKKSRHWRRPRPTPHL
jgi:hypothetical protein